MLDENVQQVTSVDSGRVASEPFNQCGEVVGDPGGKLSSVCIRVHSEHQWMQLCEDGASRHRHDRNQRARHCMHRSKADRRGQQHDNDTLYRFHRADMGKRAGEELAEVARVPIRFIFSFSPNAVPHIPVQQSPDEPKWVDKWLIHHISFIPLQWCVHKRCGVGEVQLRALQRPPKTLRRHLGDSNAVR